MIFDCFTFNNEFSILEIREHEHEELEIVHVLVESNYTFTGNKKPLQYKESKNISPDIIQFTAEPMPNNGNAWDNETFQRNFISNALKEFGAEDDDIIIISDVDEIPSLMAIQTYKPEMGLTALRMDVFWYKLNWLAEKQSWLHPRIMTYGYLKNTTPQKIRESGYDNIIDNAGWHYSYMGDADYISDKLASFSHQEYNTEQHRDKNEITRKIGAGISLWGGSQFRFLPIDETFPKYVRENQDKFKSLIKQI